MRFTDFPDDVQDDIKNYLLQDEPTKFCKLINQEEQWDEEERCYATTTFEYQNKWFQIETWRWGCVMKKYWENKFDASLEVREVTSYEKTITVTVYKNQNQPVC